VSPARVGRNGAFYTPTGRINITNAKYKNDFSSIDNTSDSYTAQNYTKAYLHHLFRANELLAYTLATIHNERFIVKLVEDIRRSILNNTYTEFKENWLRTYYQKEA